MSGSKCGCGAPALEKCFRCGAPLCLVCFRAGGGWDPECLLVDVRRAKDEKRKRDEKMSDESGRKLRKVGVLWKPREGSKSKGSGSITIGTLRQRFVILANDGKREGSKDPDYLLMSSDEPETDPYAERKAQAAPAPAARPTPPPVPVEEPGWVATDSDVPF